jgi:CheY-like chemotaxis protein
MKPFEKSRWSCPDFDVIIGFSGRGGGKQLATIQSAKASASILLVEDEALIRMMISEMVEELGHIVVAEAGSIEDAQHLAETATFDLAILDINIAGFNVQPVAEIIERRGLPFLFVSGYGVKGLPQPFRTKPILEKPCFLAQLKQEIELLLHR